MAEYHINSMEDFTEAMKNTKPGRGDVFICKDATFEMITKYSKMKEGTKEPEMVRFQMEDMIDSKRYSIDVRGDCLEDLDMPGIMKMASEELKNSHNPVTYHRYMIFSLRMDKYEEELDREDEIFKGKEFVYNNQRSLRYQELKSRIEKTIDDDFLGVAIRMNQKEYKKLESDQTIYNFYYKVLEDSLDELVDEVGPIGTKQTKLWEVPESYLNATQQGCYSFYIKGARI